MPAMKPIERTMRYDRQNGIVRLHLIDPIGVENSCDSVEKILVTPNNRCKINAICLA